MTWRGAIAAALLAGIPATAGAQAPWERDLLAHLRDSLRWSTDTTAMLQLERAEIEVARSERLEAMYHLRLGIIALRLAELQPAAPHLDHALGEFQWAAELRPDWPWPWYGLGLAEAHGRDRASGFAGGLFTMLGIDRERLSGNAFGRAIAADPAFVDGLLEFARVALEQRIDAPVQPAIEALRAATASPIGWDPALLVARGRLERLAGHPDSAAVVFRRAVLLARAPAVARVELARTVPLTGPIAGEAGAPVRNETRTVYAAAAATDDAEAVAMLRRDLEPIADSSELAEFDGLTATDRPAWLAAFWRRRDAADLREPGSRLAEHYRRWDVARREFRLPPFRRRYRWGIETWHSGDTELDDRGLVYLRQGEPSLRVVWPTSRPGIRPDPLTRNYGNESWRYDRPDGTLTLHFVARDDPDDYRLVETPLELDVAIDQLERHADDFPGLARLVRAGEYTAPWVSEEVRRQGRVAMAIATRTDGWERHYQDILAGRVQWLAAGVRDGKPLVHIVWAVDAEALRAEHGVDRGRVPVHVRAAFFDRDGRAVASLDTVQAITMPGPGARMIAARAEVPVEPGALQVRFGVELDSTQGAIFPLDSIVAPSPDAPMLDLSALLLGRAGTSLPWQVTPADTAWLDASGVYAPDDTLTLYTEAYGLAAGDRARFRIRVTRQRTGLARLFGSRSTAISVSESVIATGPRTPWRRELALRDLEPGRYALEVTVESNGRTLERRRGITIDDRR